MLTKPALTLIILALLGYQNWIITKPTEMNEYDLIIRNGKIVDGTGAHAFHADLAIKGDRIARVGDLKSATANRVIDANGLMVSPGFIDMLGQSETYLLIDPRAMSKVMQRVTTEIQD
jgi:N-acyl-D-aspartate/D-glutamate deacylase